MEERKVPTHIGIIMDGNGRWAKQRGLPRSEGHKAGAKVFKQICDYAGEIGVQSITFYAFSTENWKRPPEEVSSLMDLFREYMHEAEDRKAENLQKGMRMHFIGHREGIPEDLLNLFDTSEEESRDAEKYDVNIAINYDRLWRNLTNLKRRRNDGCAYYNRLYVDVYNSSTTPGKEE